MSAVRVRMYCRTSSRHLEQFNGISMHHPMNRRRACLIEGCANRLRLQQSAEATKAGRARQAIGSRVTSAGSLASSSLLFLPPFLLPSPDVCVLIVLLISSFSYVGLTP